MVQGCGNACMKFILFTFNFIFVAIGASLIGVGSYVLVQSKSWEEVIKTPDAGAILVVFVGVVTFTVAFFGCCGASQESQCMLSTYALVVGLVFIVEIAAAIVLLLYTNQINVYVREGIEKSFERYTESSKGDPTRGIVDVIQSSLQCCGVNGKNYWYSKREFENKLPNSCCFTLDQYANEGTCGAAESGSGVPHRIGCQQAMDDFLRIYLSLLAGIMIFAAAIKIIAACFACSLANAVKY